MSLHLNPVDTLDYWRGEFGSDYTSRNAVSDDEVAKRIFMWTGLLGHMTGDPPASILEVGCNIGLNERALRLLTRADLYAIEPNPVARTRLLEDKVLPESHLLDATAEALPFGDASMDLVFTSGVLIHIAPHLLEEACTEIHRVSARYIACIEYFADEPEEKLYRGQSGLLFKRDFGGFYLDCFSDLRPIGCGFFWKRTTGLDNATWWLFEKASAQGNGV